MFHETKIVAKLMVDENLSDQEIVDKVVGDNLFQFPTEKMIKNIAKTIVNDHGGTNIMITADHGFLYTYSPLTEEEKTEKADFVHRIIEYARRFAILTKGDDPEYLLPVKFMEGKESIITTDIRS